MTTLFANNVAATIAASVGPTDTQILLAAGQGARFPVPGADVYYVTLIHETTGIVEIALVTARAGDTLTVIRGRDSTAAVAFTANSIVEMRLCAEMLREIDYRAVRGLANGLASLDSGTKIPIAQIPAAVVIDTELTSALSSYILTSAKAAANGVASLDSGTKIPIAQIPAAVVIDTELTSALSSYILTSAKAAANGVASLDAGAKVPAAQIPDLSGTYLTKANPAATGNLTVVGSATAASFAGASLASTGTLILQAATNTIYLRPNGATSTNQTTLATNGVMTGINYSATSDKNLKKRIRKIKADPYLADGLEFVEWLWKGSDTYGRGVIAQQARKVAPHYVTRGDKHLGVDKASLALEAVIGLAARVRQLEKRTTK